MDVGLRSEHQIRYFYFCLFPQGLVQSELEGHMQKAEKAGYCYTRRNLRCKFVFGQKLDLVLWSHISQQHLRVNACQSQVIEEKMRAILTQYFYLRLHIERLVIFPLDSFASSRN